MADSQQEIQRACEVNVLLRKATNGYLSDKSRLEREQMIDFVEYRSMKSVQIVLDEISFEQALEQCFIRIDNIIANH